MISIHEIEPQLAKWKMNEVCVLLFSLLVISGMVKESWGDGWMFAWKWDEFERTDLIGELELKLLTMESADEEKSAGERGKITAAG